MTHPTTRRTVLLAAGATGAAALAAGCGGSDGGGGDGDAASGPVASDAASEAPAGRELAATGDIPVGGGTVFRDEKVVVTQPREGDFRAFSAVCTHQSCLVAEVSDGAVHCACHGSRFAVADGSVLSGPATRPLPEERITVEGDSIRLM